MFFKCSNFATKTYNPPKKVHLKLRFIYILLGLGHVFDGLIYVLTLGYFGCRLSDAVFWKLLVPEQKKALDIIVKKVKSKL
jgi:hypothetical protein